MNDSEVHFSFLYLPLVRAEAKVVVRSPRGRRRVMRRMRVEEDGNEEAQHARRKSQLERGESSKETTSLVGR